ncbi:hypothetical protein [Sulfuriflexus sp.]|uniref:hypothetical protein n=1 Tax=Sulfuriflexus sp. TaxID=2015443 RepID=UPI0028CD2663|nr:hypothetical protein [Sulfuriflexus sp.]MDT8405133.1 hypothetical protein [Sulfuriflexus sp.]
MFDREIPVWVTWLAQDKDGAWWGYSAEPHLHSTGWYENEVGDYIRLGHGTPNPDWQNSLHRKPG